MVLDRVAGVVEANAEQEIRRRDFGGGGVAEPVEHIVGPGRPEQAVAGAEPFDRRMRAIGESQSSGVAGGNHGIVARRIHPLAVEDGFDLRREPRRVGEEHHPLAGLAQATHACECLRIGRPALVHHTPDVEDVAVIIGRKRRQAGQNGNCHGVPLSHSQPGYAKRGRAVVTHCDVPMMMCLHGGRSRGEAWPGSR